MGLVVVWVVIWFDDLIRYVAPTFENARFRHVQSNVASHQQVSISTLPINRSEGKIWFLDNYDNEPESNPEIVKKMCANIKDEGGNKAVRHQERIMDLFVSSRKKTSEDVDQLIDKASVV